MDLEHKGSSIPFTENPVSGVCSSSVSIQTFGRGHKAGVVGCKGRWVREHEWCCARLSAFSACMPADSLAVAASNPCLAAAGRQLGEVLGRTGRNV